MARSVAAAWLAWSERPQMPGMPPGFPPLHTRPAVVPQVALDSVPIRLLRAGGVPQEAHHLPNLLSQSRLLVRHQLFPDAPVVAVILIDMRMPILVSQPVRFI